ncbi:MAG: Fic family protein [Sulfuricurvum sp.]|jgi:Fic family protein|uniref:Fic family protein n=1 Tax=Sulfuricurvum sp. TaxID=2025608 RepID=UPI0025E90B0C|nr:Fic family protein [Sulfuricurvum sp.]MCK9373756.1 Fic family protein [Sulfuricurvum sp.]
MSYQPPFTITSKMLSLVSDIVEIITDIKHIETNLKTPKLRKKNRVKSITGTLQIEGNTFSEEKVTNVINGITVLGTMREIAEVQGAIKAYEHFDNYVYKKEKDLLLSHKLMMEKLVSSAGSYRHTNVGVGDQNGVTHVAPPALAVPELMGNLFEWLQNTKDHPLIVSCVFHYEFEFIHPFEDGNGRVGRLWQSVILNQYKKIFGFIPIESVVREHQASYYKALEASGSAGESTPFIEFMLEIILKTLKNASNESVPKNVPRNVPKNRLNEILKLIEKNKEITSIQIAERLKVSDKTIKRDMATLKEQGRLQRVGSLKSGHWEVLDDEQ